MKHSFVLVGALGLLLSCGSDDGGGSSPDAVLKRSGALCERACGHIAEECGSKATACATSCGEEFQQEHARCLPAREEVWRCMATASLSCASSPVSSAECEEERLFLRACREDGGKETADAGSPRADAGASQCSVASADDACETCTKRSCCSELRTYDQQGAGFEACVKECTGKASASLHPNSSTTVPSAVSACLERCRSGFPTAFAALDKLESCQESRCRSACED